MRRKSKKRGPVQSKKITYDGIKFASGLERFMYMELKREKLFESYEEEQFELVSSFDFSSEAYERQSNGKGDYANRGSKKVLPIRYTPDFTGKDYIIECKGRANESFPIRYKLFKKWLHENGDDRTLYKPQNQRECIRTVELIKQKRKYGK